MDWKTSLLFSVAFLGIVEMHNLSGPDHGKVVFCYLASWSAYRKPPVHFDISDIDPTLCTHLVYTFAGLDEQTYTIKSLNEADDIEKEDGKAGYKSLTAIKKNHPHLKVTLCVGGWNEGSIKFSKMAAAKKTRTKFIRSVMKYIEKYEFDGLDIMWKYPTMRGGEPEDKDNFVTLIKELKEAFLPYGYILTATLANMREIISSAYDLVNLNRYLDLIIVLGYDYNGPWDKIVGPNAPLKGYNKQDLNHVEYTIKYMLSFGVSPDKLILGVPFYGRTYILEDPDIKEIEFGSTKAKDVGFKGPYINGTNFYGYNEVCLDFKVGVKWSHHWDEKSSTPYLRDGNRVVSYDNTRSIANKIKMGIDYNLRGFMVWSIDTDDFKGACDTPNDTYTDFNLRYHELIKDSLTKDALKSIHWLHADSTGNLKGKAYTILKNELTFHSPAQNFTNYPLLRTIHQAIRIAMEEKEINEAIKRVRKSQTEHLRQGHGMIEQTNVPCIRTCSEICFYGTNY